MTGYLVDTSPLSAYYHTDHPAHATAKGLFSKLEASRPQYVSVITMAEIDYGIQLAKARGTKHLREMMERADTIRLRAQMPVTQHTGEYYAALKSNLAQRHKAKTKGAMPRYLEDWIDLVTGKTLQLDENDLWICSQAIERDLTLVAMDQAFQGFRAAWPGLKLLHP